MGEQLLHYCITEEPLHDKMRAATFDTYWSGRVRIAERLRDHSVPTFTSSSL
jgi:hypothetical protein